MKKRARVAGLAHNVAISTLGNVAPVVVGLVTAPMLAQTLGVAGRGELAAATAPLLLAVGAVTLGAPEAITYHIARGLGRARTVLLRGLAILAFAGLLATSVVIGTAQQLSGGDDRLAGLIVLAAYAITPALLVGGLRGHAAGRERWGLIAAERSLTALLRLVSIVALAQLNLLTPESATFVIAATSVVGGVVYFALISRSSVISSVALGSPRMLRFGMGLWIGSVAGVVLSRIDQLVIVPLSDLRTLGIYAVAVTVSEVVLVFNKSVRDVVFAAESVDGQDDRLSRASRISTIVTTAGAAAVALASIVLIPWLFGDDFVEAVPVTALLLLAIVLGNPGSVAGAGLNARGKPVLRSLSLVIAAAVNIALLFLLVPIWGVFGAAVATLIGNLIAGYANILWLKIFFGISPLDFVILRRSDFVYAYQTAVRFVPSRLKRNRAS